MPANDEIELQPDPLEAMQAEGDGQLPAIRVVVEQIDAPVRTQELPRKAGGTKTISIPSTTKRYLGPDHRRASMTFVPLDGNVCFALHQASGQEKSTMAEWPMGVPCQVTSDNGLWLRAAVDGATVRVSIITESWAAGS